MKVNKKAYAETLSQFNLTWIIVDFDEDTGSITVNCKYPESEDRLMCHMGYDALSDLTKEINETYQALCAPRYNIVISLDTLDEVKAYLAHIGTKNTKVIQKVLKDEVEIDVNELTDEE